MCLIHRNTVWQSLSRDIHQYIDNCISQGRGAPTPKVLHELRLSTKQWIKGKTAYAIFSHRWLATGELTFQDISKFAKLSNGGFRKLIGDPTRQIRGGADILDQVINLALNTEKTPDDRHSMLDVMKHLCQCFSDKEQEDCRGFVKLVEFLRISSEYGCRYAWFDNGCIDKSSSAELEESIRSMFNWYQNSQICIIHLADTTDVRSLRKDPWFTRGWTLQELLAPRRVKFYGKSWQPIIPPPDADKDSYDNDNDSDEDKESENNTDSDEDDDVAAGTGDKSSDSESNKDSESDKDSSESDKDSESDKKGYYDNDKDSGSDEKSYLWRHISDITQISSEHIFNFKPGVHQARDALVWVSKRRTTRIEDIAYCLIGLLKIPLSIAYGEGENAFYRLQLEILQRTPDMGLFSWVGQPAIDNSMLAAGPHCFSSLALQPFFPRTSTDRTDRSYSLTNYGLRIPLSVYTVRFGPKNPGAGANGEITLHVEKIGRITVRLQTLDEYENVELGVLGKITSQSSEQKKGLAILLGFKDGQWKRIPTSEHIILSFPSNHALRTPETRFIQ